MGRLHLKVGGASVAVGVIVVAAPWVRWPSPSGAELAAGWSEFSPASLTVAVASAAALAASTLLHGLWLRAISALQALLASVAFWLALSDVLAPRPILASLTTASVGVDLGEAPMSSEPVWSAFAITTTLAALLGVVVSGLIALWRPAMMRTAVTHYERPLPDSEDPWEQLTRGVDPTGR